MGTSYHYRKNLQLVCFCFRFLVRGPLIASPMYSVALASECDSSSVAPSTSVTGGWYGGDARWSFSAAKALCGVTKVQSLDVEDVFQRRSVCCVPSDEGLVGCAGKRRKERWRERERGQR